LTSRETWPLRRGSCAGGAEEPEAEIVVAKALEEVLAAEDGGEEAEIGGRRGIERTRRAALAIAHGLDEAVEGAMRRRGIVDDGEGIETAMAGRRRHGGVTREIRDAFRQGVPPESSAATAAGAAPDFELVGIVDDGLHPQHAAVLVVKS
jgi:hypothetical protein